MKMAKASEADLEMAFDLCNALESISGHWNPCMPKQIERLQNGEEVESFDVDDAEQCKRVVQYLIELTNSASLVRVVFGMAVLLDPKNKIVDPNSDTLERYPAQEVSSAGLSPTPPTTA
jgi:hypothetical protein